MKQTLPVVRKATTMREIPFAIAIALNPPPFPLRSPAAVAEHFRTQRFRLGMPLL